MVTLIWHGIYFFELNIHPGCIQVTKGATTIWEHWDGIMEDGSFWSKDMNSYNHYAYGSVADWVYGVAAGILPRKDAPGYAKVTIAPHPDKRLDWLRAELDTRHGHISSFWTKEDDSWRYEITVPVEADIVIDGVCHSVRAGSYCFYSDQKKRLTFKLVQKIPTYFPK